jgi:hypothetical protein
MNPTMVGRTPHLRLRRLRRDKPALCPSRMRDAEREKRSQRLYGVTNHNNFGTGEAGRARHSVRAALGQTYVGAHGVTRPTFSVS